MLTPRRTYFLYASLGSLRTVVAIRAYYRRDLALAQLETALQLYFENGDRGSIITLAGAADEVFGKYLERAGRESSFKSLVVAVTEIRARMFGEPFEPEEVKAIAEFLSRRISRAYLLSKYIVDTIYL